MDPESIRTLLLLLIPVVLIQIGLAIYALADLSRRKAVRWSKPVWIIALIVTMFAFPTGILVSAAYLVWGRQVEANDDSH
jgi:Na+/H+-dicarboxylate symporter